MTAAGSMSTPRSAPGCRIGNHCWNGYPKTAARPSGRRRTTALREVLDYFKTNLSTHCRLEESELYPAFPQNRETASQVAAFRAQHERFAVDLDKFERQMVSYGLSRDPTVLVSLGARIIREMRGHLEAEEKFQHQLGE